MKKLHERLSALATRLMGRITLKIWLSTAAAGLAVILLIFLMTQLFMRNYVLESSLHRTRSATVSAAEFTDKQLDNIINRLISICARTKDFRSLLLRVYNDNPLDTQLSTDLQDHLSDLSVCNSLVSSAILVSRGGAVYHTVSRSLNDVSPGYTLGYPEESIHSITLLPVRKSPVTADGQVLPMAVPFTFEFGNQLLYFADSVETSSAMLYLFLDVASLNETLALYNDVGVSYLMNSAGDVLNYTKDSYNYEIAQACDLSAAVADWPAKDSEAIYLGDWCVLRERIGQQDLYLVHLTRYEDAIEPLTDIANSLVLLALTAIVFITLATLFIAIYLAKPLQQVNQAVRAIESGEYTSDMVLRQQDEIGELSQSVDSMYRTIQAQIDQIRHEREAKDSMEIRLFAEQINPHFLYNTLEYINLEVYNHHTENASMMIQALGEFLRIGLNFGREQIPLERELEHVQAYISIMNHRFGQEIGFTTDVPEYLLNEPVAKIILQPLVENSIRHGFQLESSGAYIEIPTVSIRASLSDDMLTLSVIDNGLGFDVESAQRIMHDDPSLHKHVGLSNVYHRLKLYYGDGADIELQSMPYYKNTVSIRIPFKSAAERSNV